MKRKALILAVADMALIATMLIGCGSNDNTQPVQVEIEQIAPAKDVEQTEESTVTPDVEESVTEVKEEKEDVKETSSKPKLKVAYVGTVAGEILERASENLSYLGYQLEAVQCDNYADPNTKVLSGEADATLCCNEAYLDSYNTINSTKLKLVEREYIEPYGIFPGKITDLNHMPSTCTVALMEGEITTARALHLLQQKGLLELKEGCSYQACMDDVTANPYNISIQLLNFDEGYPDASKYDLIICDFNHALIEGINPEDALGCENRNSELTDLFAVGVVADESKASSVKVQALCKAINSESVEEYIYDTYFGAVVDYR